MMLALMLALAITAGACRSSNKNNVNAGSSAVDPGISKTTIHLGSTYALSGPLSAYASIVNGIDSYFKYLNAEKGGLGGRQVTFTFYDDQYTPAMGLANVRRLVEQDKVFAVFNPLGTPVNLAIRDYLNQQKVPQLFVATGAATWGADPKAYPWTIGWQPDYVSEGKAYGKYITDTVPNAKIGILRQNDDFGKDYVTGLKAGLKDKANEIIKEVTYEATDASVDTQVSSLKDSGATVFFDVTTPKFAAQAIKRTKEIGWTPTHVLASVSASPTAVMKVAGFDASQGIISASYLKDPADPAFANDAAIVEYKRILGKYGPSGANPLNPFFVYSHAVSQTLVKTVEAMKGNTRQGLMDSARSLDHVKVDLLLPGITNNTSKTDGYPVQQFQLVKFKGEAFERFGDIIDASKL
jgi:branched-chain amino acid transport system substrate-binding protein